MMIIPKPGALVAIIDLAPELDSNRLLVRDWCHESSSW